MAKYTTASSQREREILEKLEHSRKYRVEKKTQQGATTVWLRYGVTAFIIVLAVLSSIYYDSGGKNASISARKRPLKSEVKHETAQPKNESTKKWRKIIDRELWEERLDKNEDPDGEPADLYPKYHDIFGNSLPDLPEIFLMKLLHRLGTSYQIAQALFEKDQNSTEVGSRSNGVATFIRFGAKVLTQNEEGFANALEVLKRDKAGVGRVDLTETLFEAIESVKENVRTLQTSLLNRLDDITSEEDEGGGEGKTAATPKHARHIELASKHTSELFLVNQGIYNAIQRVLKSNEYADDEHLTFDLAARSQKHGLTVVQTVAKYRLHRLLPVFVGLGAPTEGAVHYAVANGDVYTTALLCQGAADTLDYTAPTLFGGLTAMQLARELNYPLIYTHIDQALALRDGTPDSEEYQKAKMRDKLPLGDEYASQTQTTVDQGPSDHDPEEQEEAQKDDRNSEGKKEKKGGILAGLFGNGGGGRRESRAAIVGATDIGGYEDLHLGISGAMGSVRHLPALYRHTNGSILEAKEAKHVDNEDITVIKEDRDVDILTGKCNVRNLTADQLSGMSISDVRLLFQKGAPVRLNLNDILPRNVVDALHKKLHLDSLLAAIGGLNVTAGEIPYATKFNAGTETMTLAEYVERHVRGATATVKDMFKSRPDGMAGSRVVNASEAAKYLAGTAHGIPLYLFGQGLNEKLPILQEEEVSSSRKADDGDDDALSLRSLLEEGSNHDETRPLGDSVTISHLLQAASAGIVPHTGRRLHMSHIFQFFLGGPLSGAPFHDHGGAFNFLLHGRKMWHLLPPSRDVYSSMHPLKFALAGGVENAWYPYRNADDATAGRIPESLAGPCSLTQEPGELLWLPPRWSHTTLALSENVGFAVELVEAGVGLNKAKAGSS